MLEDNSPVFSTGFAQLVWKRGFARERTFETRSRQGDRHR